MSRGGTEMKSIELVSLDELKTEYGDRLRLIQEHVQPSSDEQLTKIAALMVSICPFCFSTLKPCSCMRDD